MYSAPLKQQCNNVVLTWRRSLLPSITSDGSSSYCGRLPGLRFQSICTCYRIRKYIEINPISILLFVHYAFLSLKAHIFNFVPYICNVFNFLLHRLSSKASQQPRVNKCFILNKLKRQTRWLIEALTVKHGSHWRGTATFLELAWRQMGVASLCSL